MAIALCEAQHFNVVTFREKLSEYNDKSKVDRSQYRSLYFQVGRDITRAMERFIIVECQQHKKFLKFH